MISKSWKYAMSVLRALVFLYRFTILFILYDHSNDNCTFSREKNIGMLYCQFHTWTNFITNSKTKIVVDD